MKLTIMSETSTVGKDAVFYDGLNLTTCQIPNNVWALQWNGSNGHIEFTTSIANENIASLPSWADACVVVWNAEDLVRKQPPVLTSEQIIVNNENKANGLLILSDWSVLSDVSLQNKTEWVSYRGALRQIATTPTLDPTWPVKPSAVWS